MHTSRMRQQLAEEAARLLFRGESASVSDATRRATRRLSRKRISRSDLPDRQEVQAALMSFQETRGSVDRSTALRRVQMALLRLQSALPDVPLHVERNSLTEGFAPGRSIPVRATLPLPVVEAMLLDRGIPCEPVTGASDFSNWTSGGPESASDSSAGSVSGFDAAGALTVWLDWELSVRNWNSFGADILLADPWQPVAEFIAAIDSALGPAGDGWAPTLAEPTLEDLPWDLLTHLEQLRPSPHKHPEGDLLYHSLQVFELGTQRHPCDVEFLAACLFHDVGYLVNPRQPTLASVDVLTPVASPRLVEIVAHLPDGWRYLQTGQMPRSLRKSELFELVVDLARCDRDGRVPGEQVRTWEAAGVYLAEIADE